MDILDKNRIMQISCEYLRNCHRLGSHRSWNFPLTEPVSLGVCHV